MIAPLYALNLGMPTPTPTPTGTGAYGPWLLYGLNLATPPAATYPDLIAAAVARIRGYQSGAIPAALGEIAGAPKIWSDAAMGSPAAPWVTIEEPQESLSQETDDGSGDVNYVGPGSLEITVYATTKTQAKALRSLIVAALNDAPLRFADGTLISDHLRVAMPMNSPVPGVFPNAPHGYQASAKFTYFVERTYS